MNTLYQIIIEGEEPVFIEKENATSHFESAYNSDASQWIFKVELYGIQLRLNATRKMTTLPENQKYEESPGIYMPWVMTGRNHGYLVIAEEVIDEEDDEIDYNSFDEPFDDIVDLNTWDEI